MRVRALISNQTMSYSNYYANSYLFHGSMKAMATQLDVLIVGEELHSRRIWNQIEKAVVDMEKLMSRYDENGEIYTLNRKIARYPFSPSERLCSIIEDCRKYYQLTYGIFDITLGNFSQLLFDDNAKTIYSFSETIELDLGGYGKGYALKEIEIILRQSGVEKALVNFGNSSVLAVGVHPHGEYWPVSIENPFTREVVADLQLCDTSMSVSGNTPRHNTHIIDPYTGKYISGKRLAVVVCEDPVLAEVMTTTMLIADDNQQKAISEKFKEISEKHIYEL